MQEYDKFTPPSEIVCRSEKDQVCQEHTLKVNDMTSSPEGVGFSTRNFGLLRGFHPEEEDDQGLIESIGLPQPEDLSVEEFPLHANSIQERLTHKLCLLMLKIEDSPVEEGRACEGNIVQLIDPGLVQGLPRENRVETKVILHDYIEDVLVEIVADQVGDATVRLPPMHEKERLEELKFTDGIITGPCSLHPLTARDAHSYVGLENHGNIISTISNSKCHFLWISLADQHDNVSLLLG